VLLPSGDPLTGVYAVGWIKRGPTGILGTNKRDADETVRCLVEYLALGRLPAPAEPDPGRVEALLAERNPNLVTVDGWRAIDSHERGRGAEAGRPRVKLSSRDELLDVAGAATGAAADAD
jgi:ferredoxin--NADP+ reductase